MRLILPLLAALFLFAACNSKSTYNISGTFLPETEGSAILYKVSDQEITPIDTCAINNNEFSFEGEIELPELYILGLEGKGYLTQFFNEATSIDMIIYPDSGLASVIEGSKSNDLLTVFNEEYGSQASEMQALRTRFMKAQSVQNTDEMETIRQEAQTIEENLKLYARNFVKENNNTPVGAYVYVWQLMQQADGTEIDSMANFFDASIENSTYVQFIKKKATKSASVVVGQPAPDFELNTPDGMPIALSSLRGQYVLIDFWASWCGPCRQENPNVVKLYNQYHSKGFEILGVSLDKSKEKWVEAIKKDGLTWPQVSDLKYWQSAAAELYNVKSIPHTVLIDKDGKIMEIGLRGEALQNKLAELFD